MTIDLSTYVLTPGDSLEMECDQIEVTSMTGWTEPDKAWRATDSNGHVHHWADGYPTLRHIEEPDYIAVDSEGYPEEFPGDSWYECLVCGELVEPGAIYHPPDGFKRYVPGVIRGWLIHDGQRIRISGEEYIRLSQDQSA